MAYNKINYSAMCQGTWSEPSVMSWSAWLQLGWDDAVSLSGYTSKCRYKPVLRPSDNFVFSNIYVWSQGCFQTELQSSLKSKNPNTAGTLGDIRWPQVGMKPSRAGGRPRSALLDLLQKILPGTWGDVTPHGLNLPHKYSNSIALALLLIKKDCPLL